MCAGYNWNVSGSGNWRVIFQFEYKSAVFAAHFDSFGGNLFQIGKTIPQNSCIVDLAVISNPWASLRLLVGMANLQFSSFHNIVDWQKQYNIRGFVDIEIESTLLTVL